MSTQSLENDKGHDPLFAGKESDFLLSVYNTLRAELLQRTSTRSQIINLALTAFGAVLGADYQGFLMPVKGKTEVCSLRRDYVILCSERVLQPEKASLETPFRKTRKTCEANRPT